MTNEDFRTWRERHFRSPLAASTQLGLHRDTIKALETGLTKNGEPYPVKPYIALMCAAVDHGLHMDQSKPRRLAGQLRLAADMLEATDP